MKERGLRDLALEGFSTDSIVFASSADMRYRRQTWELSVPTPHSVSSPEEIQKIAEDFHTIHKRTYGYEMRDDDVMAVNLRFAAIGEVPKIKVKKRTIANKNSGKDLQVSLRKVFSEGNYVDYTVFDRTRLIPGNIVQGPAIIGEYGSTTVIPRDMKASIDAYDNIIIEG
jgi:N-methylhydantoinase A